MRIKKNPIITVSDPVGNSSPHHANVKVKNAYCKYHLFIAKHI